MAYILLISVTLATLLNHLIFLDAITIRILAEKNKLYSSSVLTTL